MEKLLLENGTEIQFPKNEVFRGWDAADEYLLSQEIESKITLVIGDTDGALTCGLSGEVISFVTSCLSEKTISNTLSLNEKVGGIITDVEALPENVDTVIIKLPKSIDMLEYYIQIIGKKYPGVKVIAGGMVKYMPITMVRLMEEYFTDVTTSLAKKKARLIFGTAGFNNENPTVFPKSYKTEHELTVVSYPGVFSSDHLDIGTRFLLSHIPKNRAGVILDLGCASGVLGLVAKKLNPEAEIVLTDESYMATMSAAESFKANDFEGTFKTINILKDYESDSVDIILCNPPFHQENRVLTDIAVEMFKQSRKVLRRGGTLIVVANKHLGYHKKLRSIYHNLNRVAENEKFIIFSVRKV
ncbi:MAG: class I SAM-dependent methyltransferase [Spirochaetaceae bacterium]